MGRRSETMPEALRRDVSVLARLIDRESWQVGVSASTASRILHYHLPNKLL